MRKLFSIFLVIIVLCAVAIAQQFQTSLIYRWQDGQGKFYYTDDYSTIPAQFRYTVVVGRFNLEGSVLPPQKGGAKDSQTSKPSDESEPSVVVLQDSYQVRDDYLYIEGQVKNLLDKTITEVKANIEFYSKYGQLLSTNSVYLVPSVLGPGEIGKFTVTAPAMPQFHYYKTEIVYRER